LMPVKKKVRDRPSKSAEKDSKKSGKPPGGKFAPIIEELGKMQSQLEAKAGEKRLSLQEQLMMEIEGELLKKEENVRENFGQVFKEDPQALVELISTMRRYGDAEILRDIVFAVETMYDNTLDDLPGGKDFWDKVRTEAAPPEQRPAGTPADTRLRRLQAIDILREAILSYDIISAAPEGSGAAEDDIEEVLEPLPDEKLPEKQVEKAPDTVQEKAPDIAPAPAAPEKSVEPEPQVKVPVPRVPDKETKAPDLPRTPTPAGLARSEEELAELQVKEREIEEALKDISRREKEIIDGRAQGQQLADENRKQEARLKLDDEELTKRADALAGKEKEFQARENELRMLSEGLAARTAAHEDERTEWLSRQQELSKALDATKEMRTRTEEDIQRLRGEADAQKRSSERMKKREETFTEAERKLEADRRELESLRQSLEGEAQRVKMLELELRSRPPAGEQRLPPELEARMKQLEAELTATKQELKARGSRTDIDSAKLREEMDRTREDFSRREEELSSKEAILGDREKSLSAEASRLQAEAQELDNQRQHLIDVARQVKEREEELDRIQAEQATVAAAGPGAAPVKPPQVAAPPQVAPPQVAPAPQPRTQPPQVAPAPQPRTQPQQVAPAPQPRAQPPQVAPAPVPAMPMAPAPEAETEPVSKVRCPGCKNIIPLYTKDRPLRIRCNACGKEGVLK